MLREHCALPGEEASELVLFGGEDQVCGPEIGRRGRGMYSRGHETDITVHVDVIYYMHSCRCVVYGLNMQVH